MSHSHIKFSSIRLQGPQFFNSLSPEIQNSERTSVCLAKDLKNSFSLSQIYSLLGNILPLSFSFLYFIFKIIHFNISCCPHNLYDVPYIVSKPIVHKPQASKWASLPLPLTWSIFDRQFLYDIIVVCFLSSSPYPAPGLPSSIFPFSILL